ncbi:MAG: hypothetical protein JWM14_2520 [Chitinophagaceae bacterium]|nr:hypothetical protein [Chitinophagaceae bacterium]
MKKCLLLALFSILGLSASLGQVSPYSLAPDWYFGIGGRMTFPSGNFPTSGAPTTSTMPTNNSVGVEASTDVCFKSGSVAFYTNSQQVYNANPANASWNDYIRSLTTDGTCAGSSTGAGVSFPDPASPTNAFYLVLANDVTSGSCNHAGVNRYRFTGTGTSVVYNAGQTLMAPDAFAGEAITAGTDGIGGYWVVIHNSGTANTFRVFHFTAGGITTLADQTVGAAVSDVSGSQSYLKISPCQDKIAYHSGGTLVVHNWDRTTGTVGAELRRITPASYGVGLEFSPDGSKIFYSGQASAVTYVDIASGTSGNVTSSSSWSMQLGNDGKIYCSPGGASLGVISAPNTAPAYTTLGITGGGSTFRGLSNIAWMTPDKPVITATLGSACNEYDFSFIFKNYFNGDIGIDGTNITWVWGDASANTTNNATPTHIFPAGSGGPYHVVLTFKDSKCGQTWTANIDVTITCPAPVELISFDGVASPGGVDLIWKTAMELNNDYFDLQRSTDGIHFYSIAEIKGAGTSNSTLSYPYRDKEVTSGLVYYKLAQHDYDGTISYSKIVAVHFDKAGSTPVVVAPNPFSSSFVLSKIFSEAATVSVYDIYGRLLEQKVTSAEEFSLTLGEGLANGSYIVQYLTGSNAYTIHVEKK